VQKINSIKIGIGGKIGSGKTTLSKKIKLAFGYDCIAIGEVLKNYCIDNQVSSNRENLNKLSSSIVKQCGKNKKFDWIMKNSPNNINWLKNLVIDGFRNEEVYIQCKKKFSKTILVYCDCPYKIQIERIMKRDGVNKIQATKLAAQKIEIESKKLRKYADIIFTNKDQPQKVIKQIKVLVSKVDHL